MTTRVHTFDEWWACLPLQEMADVIANSELVLVRKLCQGAYVAGELAGMVRASNAALKAMGAAPIEEVTDNGN